MSTLEHLMGVTPPPPPAPPFQPNPLKWDSNKAFSELEEKYLQPLLSHLSRRRQNQVSEDWAWTFNRIYLRSD